MRKKIKTIIVLSILSVLGIVYGVFYILYPQNTQKVTSDVFDYICTKPLPVIGITILTLFFIVLRIISLTGIGRKALKECREDLQESKKTKDSTHLELVAFQEFMENKFKSFEEKHNDNMREICSNIPNKNVRELGDKFYGKERINSNPEKE